jgi:hypothetical protein
MLSAEKSGSAKTRTLSRLPDFEIGQSALDAGQFIVGMTNSAPSFTPEGQRDVTVFVLV